MFLFQLDIPVPNSPYFQPNNLGNQLAGSSDQTFLTILLVVGLAILVLALFFLLRFFIRRAKLMPIGFKKTILLLTMPKEASENQAKEENIETIKSQIAIAESLFSTLGGMRAQRGMKAWFSGRDDHFSFEMVAKDGFISFYIVVNPDGREYIEQQILAQYPEAHLIEVEDYNIFSPQSVVLADYLKFTRDYIFPLKTYLQFSSDPLNAIANSLSKIQIDDGAAIQIVARSAKKQWHRKGFKIAQLLQNGKTIDEAMAETGHFNLSWFSSWFKPNKSQEEELKKPQNTPSPMQQELIKGIEQKTSKAGLDCNIRIVVAAKNELAAQSYLKNIIDSFSQFNLYQYGNTFKAVKQRPEKLAVDYIYRHYREAQKVLLNTEEFATIFHPPTPFLETPNIRWLLAKKLAAPTNLPQAGLLLGENVYRSESVKVYLPEDDRRRHMYIIGMTGTGKSVLMSNAALQDIQAGRGVCVIDPHGSLVESILEGVPKERMDDVIYFNPSDVNRPIGLNMLEAKSPEQQDFIIQEMIAIFYKLVTDPAMIGPMFEHNMRNAMLTLMADTQHPGTIVEIPRIFSDKDFQKYKVSKVTDPMVRSYWEQEMAKTSDFHKSEMLGYLISKVGRFVENAMIRNIIGQPKSGFDFRDVMDNKKILLVNLSKGTTGEVNSNLIGLILVAKLQMAALSRTDIPEDQRNDFYLYIDEFQNFITDSISTILAEARKYKLDMI
ncbi:MAG: type IV secretion system DNA-binding domain-containing protein, partial [Candidatus Buchananbacteria bacterium]|nr:type IV secretion system DNA-binding domain-containing protein [Candidatus Buchananbacteria bacterium]